MNLKQAYLQGFISQMHKRAMGMPGAPLSHMPKMLGSQMKPVAPPKPAPVQYRPPVVPGQAITGSQPLPKHIIPPSQPALGTPNAAGIAPTSANPGGMPLGGHGQPWNPSAQPMRPM